MFTFTILVCSIATHERYFSQTPLANMSSSILEALIRPTDGKVDFSHHKHHFIPWYCHLQSLLSAIGASNILRKDYRSVLLRPPVDVYRDNLAQYQNEAQNSSMISADDDNDNQSSELLSDADCAIINEYTTLVTAQDALFDRALKVVLDSLTSLQVASVFPIISCEEALNARQKAIAIVDHFTALYGTNERQNTEPIVEEIKRIPPATDCASAEHLLGALSYWNNCLRLIHPSAAIKDAGLIEILIPKLQASMFAYAVVKISTPGVLFSYAVMQIHNTIVLYQQRRRSSQQEQEKKQKTTPSSPQQEEQHHHCHHHVLLSSPTSVTNSSARVIAHSASNYSRAQAAQHQHAPAQKSWKKSKTIGHDAGNQCCEQEEEEDEVVLFGEIDDDSDRSEEDCLSW
jgi:hypothetical protein